MSGAVNSASEGFSTLEFTVDMTCSSCARAAEAALSPALAAGDISSVNVNVERQSVVVATRLPAEAVRARLESTGKKAVLVGMGAADADGTPKSNLGACVAAMGGFMGAGVRTVAGVIRFVQVDSSTCVVEGTVDGLSPGEHALAVHECGDLSQGCSNVGGHYNPRNARHGSPQDDADNRHVGDLGNVTADENGRASFKFSDSQLKVWDIVGRSVSIAEKRDDFGRGNTKESQVNGSSGALVTCGIIARSAGLFENVKKVCACDGVTIWDERDTPIAGKGRSKI